MVMGHIIQPSSLTKHCYVNRHSSFVHSMVLRTLPYFSFGFSLNEVKSQIKWPLLHFGRISERLKIFVSFSFTFVVTSKGCYIMDHIFQTCLPITALFADQSALDFRLLNGGAHFTIFFI